MPSEYNPNETARDWETLQQNEGDITQRLRIAGGWLYRTVIDASVSVVFVPIASENTDA
jgi:hypothetical protein